MTRSVVFPLNRCAVLASAVMLLVGAVFQPAKAHAAPFTNFSGNWSGTGVIRVEDQDNRQTNERIRCTGTYRQTGSQEVNLKLTCRSDSYSFDLSGNLEADANNQITGQWTEHTRLVVGSLTGQARGDRLLIRAESPALNANLSMVTGTRSQSVNLKAAGGGQQVTASITLRRL